ncbi:MAG: GGDEF domain-containing protein, partial [Pseudomonadota bacterium]
VIVGETEDFAIAADEAHVLLAFTPYYEENFADLADVLGLKPDTVQLIDAADGAPTSPHAIALPNNGGDTQAYFVWRPVQLGHMIALHVAPFAALSLLVLMIALAIPLRAHAGAVAQLAESEARNRRMANHDALTGLPNRAQFDAKLESLLADAVGDPFAVMCIDLDKFKAVNDTHGHNAGDAVLTAVADRFVRCMGDVGLVARVGGDEFIALITKHVDADHLAWLGEALIDTATRPVAFEGLQLRVGCSIGVSIWPRDGRSSVEIVAAADAYLYEAKRAGRGRVTITPSAADMSNAQTAKAA